MGNRFSIQIGDKGRGLTWSPALSLFGHFKLFVSRAVADMSVRRVTAEEEYAKNPDLKKEEVDKLREWMSSQPHLPVPTEEQLILFYHSCYYDMEAAKSCVEVYYTLRTNTPEFFSGRTIERPELKKALEVLRFGAVPVKDPNGYQIIFHGLQQYESSKYVFVDGVKLLTMAIDACLFTEGTVPGYIFLFDMKGVRLSHLTRLSVTYLKKFFTYIQEGMPMRLKAIHVVNTMPIIDKIMFMIKPFMKKELLSLIHFHYGDNETVYKDLPKSCLPKDLGGDLEDTFKMHDRYIQWMGSLLEIFEDEERYRADEKKRLSKKNRGGSIENVSSLRNLTLD